MPSMAKHFLNVAVIESASMELSISVLFILILFYGLKTYANYILSPFSLLLFPIPASF